MEVQRFGCASLRELARESEDRAWLGRLGGIELVLNAMRSFQADTELQQPPAVNSSSDFKEALPGSLQPNSEGLQSNRDGLQKELYLVF